MEKTELDFTNQPVPAAAPLSLVRGGKRQAEDASRPALGLDDLARYADDWVSENEYLLRSPATITGKREALAKLLWWLRQNQCTECGAKELRRFLAYIGNGHLRPEGRWGNPRLTQPPSARTIQYYFNYLRTFFRWLESYELVQDNPMRGLAVPRPEQHQIQPFSTEQIAALLEAARRSPHPRRDEALLLFMLDTGVRASEVCGLKMKDLEHYPTYGQATVLGKGRKRRTVAFSRRAARSLWQYLRESPPRRADEPVFLADRGPAGSGAPLTRSGLLQLYERLGRRARVQNVRCSPHTMRHTFAIRFLRRGGDTFTLQAMLGHTALHQTQKYLKIAQADVANKHRQFSPADEL